MQKVNSLKDLQQNMQYLKINFSKSYLIPLALLFTLGSCKKEPGSPTVFPLTAGQLSASKAAVVIDSSDPGAEAVKFSWSAEPNSLIRYRLILTAAGKTDTVIIPQNTIGKSFTNAELNTILLNKLGLEIGVAKDIKAIVHANVPVNGKTAETNTLTINVTPAKSGAAYTKLWIVGDATPNGWDINNPNVMTADPANAFQFKYNGILNAGEFKIPTTTGNWGADFFMPLTNNPDITATGAELVVAGKEDKKWKITVPGAYKILLNVSSGPSIQIKPFTAYAGLWMVGDATVAGWDINAAVAMVVTPGNPFEFTYSGPLKAGEFKIPVTAGTFDTDYFMPAVNGEGITSTSAIFVKGGNPDNKWKIEAAGNYRVTVNQLYETIKFQKI